VIETHRRRFWVVSPNVRNDSSTVSKWRQQSVRWKAAFMGYSPNDREHKQSGYKFAHVIRPSDVVLIARRNNKKPEIVGFGVVDGKFETRLKGFKPPQSFGSLRKLKPFKPWSAAPSNLLITDALGSIAALHKLHPETNPNHKRICKWMERKLAEPWRTRQKNGKRVEDLADDIEVVALPDDDQLEYKVRTPRKVLLAKKTETKLLLNYRDWLKNQQRKLFLVKYKNLRCDAYEEDRRNLIEAKCSAKREYIRMAVGQLLDYAYLGRKLLGKPNMAVLLPERPAAKLYEWLSGLHIFVAWREKDAFLDNANGQFT
jgi:hypothetical protein